MTTAVMNPDESWVMNPECQTVAETYLMTTDVNFTAKELGIPREKVVYYLGRPEVKRFLDQIYLEQGYLNRHRLNDILTEVIDLKLEEMRESELGSKKDIADLIELALKMRAQEAKNTADSPTPRTQVNIQNNNAAGFGENYSNLLEKLIGAK